MSRASSKNQWKVEHALTCAGNGNRSQPTPTEVRLPWLGTPGHQPSRHHRQAARFRTHRRTLPQCPPGGGSPPCGRHPGLDSRPRQGSATAVDTAGGGGRPLPSPAERAWTVGCRRPPCPRPAQGAAAVSAADSGRPASSRPHSRTSSGHRRGVRPADALGCGPGRRSRQTPTVRPSDSGRGLRTPAARRRPARWTPARLRQGHADTAAAACWTAGSRSVHCRLHVRLGTGPKGAASASTAMARPPDP
jgi:hypothetical protein